MADGKTHAYAAGKWAVTITIAAGLTSIVGHPVASGLIVGAWGAVIAGPDMDMQHVVTEDEARFRRWNPIIGRLWSLYWWPYASLIPHRGRSHTLPDGTMDRFILLFWPFLALSVGLIPTFGPWVVVFWGLVLVGQMVVDAVHLRLDGLL